MRVPLSWLREYADVPDVPAREIAGRLIAAGLEVETVDTVGHDVRGVVVGEVLGIEELTGFKKPIRHCQVATGEPEPRGVICGAVNFAVGDRVPVALPGGVLPGGFEIAQRRAYGHVSDGMICSPAELAIGDDHSGILVLEKNAPIGADFVGYAGLRDDVLDVAVTPDRGYSISVRGMAREAATAFGVAFHDPADIGLPEGWEAEGGAVHPASIDDPSGCDRFVLREVHGLNPATATPVWMRVRLSRAGMRPVSLAVDITNYLMLELGQPLHAYDKTKLTGPIVVRRARPGERLETLDHIVRDLDPDDILITDSSGPIGMAGTMGGLNTEIDETSADLVIEGAHFSAVGVARMVRRHKLHSEASYRFERGVDHELPLRATAKAVALLAELGGATVVPGSTHAHVPVEPVTIRMAAGHPDRVAGVTYGREVVERRLRDVGCQVAPADGDAPPAEPREHGEHGRHGHAAEILAVVPPSWRPDLSGPNDLAEEVIRLEGYENVPVRLPAAPAGRGLTAAQRMRRAVSRAVAAAGYIEVLSFPFVSTKDFDALEFPADDPRRRALALANPLSEDEPLLRTTLLPGLVRTLVRNIGRGFADTALYEMGLVYLPRTDGPRRAPRLRVDRGPVAHEVEALEAALPQQPLHAAVVLAGNRDPAGWWGEGRQAVWADAIQAAREICDAAHVTLTARAAQEAPWHPGRCAALFAHTPDGEQRPAGFAGELHPRVVAAFGLPPRTCAMEIDLSLLESMAVGPVQAPVLSAFPVATQDVALVVPGSVPAADVAQALRDGIMASGSAGLLEEIRLFDVYTGEQIGHGRKSLAYTIRLRAPDRTLTAREASTARDAAVAEAARRTGAVLRGT
ncbi:MAG: phenylalanine--tRNA ligase subunit beta [Micromonosporaceae bacterium]